MITAISQNNISYFEHLIPDDLIEDVLIRRDTFGLGCLRRDLDGNFDGFGVLVFVKECDETEEVENYHIKWLYVDSNRRGDGIGSELLMDLFWDFGNTEVPTMTVDIPALEAYEEVGNFLNDWHFQFRNTYTLDFEIELSKLKKNKYFSGITKDTEIKGVESLIDVDEKSLKVFLREMRKKYIKRGMYVDLMLTDYKKDYFDPNLSSVVIKNETVEGALLVHTRPSGRLEIVVLDTLQDDKQKYLVRLINKSYQAALDSKIKNARVYHKTYNERGMDLIDSLFGNHETPVVFRGMIENSSVAISTEQWEEMKAEYWDEHPGVYAILKGEPIHT